MRTKYLQRYPINCNNSLHLASKLYCSSLISLFLINLFEQCSQWGGPNMSGSNQLIEFTNQTCNREPMLQSCCPIQKVRCSYCNVYLPSQCYFMGISQACNVTTSALQCQHVNVTMLMCQYYNVDIAVLQCSHGSITVFTFQHAFQYYNVHVSVLQY